MSRKIAIIDYGLGNLFSIKQACEYVGLESVITADVSEIENSDALILPGVGAFADAMDSLRENSLIDPILNFIKSKRPFMGICLGMQLLFSESEEFGDHKGLDLIKGRIRKFPFHYKSGESLKVPQIQWNQIYKNSNELWQESPLVNIEEGAYMQFVHSFYAEPESNDIVSSFTEYGGIKYASSIIQDNVIGIQFHPEKSGLEGLKIYKSWANFIKNKSY